MLLRRYAEDFGLGDHDIIFLDINNDVVDSPQIMV